MGLLDKLRGEFIDIIEWLDDSGDTMVYRFERYGNEIKHGAKLIVRPSQAAVFVNEGQVTDVFLHPGTFTLDARNLPILATLKGWKYGFESPFKAEVYFINLRLFTDLKWGTKNPVMLRDAEFGAVRLRAFGTYVIRVSDPALFVRELVGTNGRFSTGDISEQLRNLIIARFTDILGESKIPVLDLAGNYDELGEFLTKRIAPEFANYGLDLNKLLVENISLPPAVEEALDKRTSMGIVGDLGRYTQYQAAAAMEAAAKNPGGAAASGIGVGMGVMMAGQMSGAAAAAPGSGGASRAAQDAPPPVPGAQASSAFYVAIDGKQAGPYDLAALQTQAQDGRVTRSSLVWKAGMPEWKAAGEVAEVAEVLSRVPPPLPK